MIDTVLFDLDQTLLPYADFERFGECLFASFVECFADRMRPDLFMPAFMKGVEAMDANRRSGPTNTEAFGGAFCPMAGLSPEVAKEAFAEFYATWFPGLREHTRPSPEARPLLTWLLAHGYRIAIATGFQTSLAGLEERLRWADVPISDFPYSFLPTADNMHASKPHPEYYEEILEHLGRRPHQCLMVGDGWGEDIVSPASIGIFAYWVNDGCETPADRPRLLLGQGTLSDFRRWLAQGGLQAAGGVELAQAPVTH